MAFQRGDVVLIPFPFTDLSATKTRPAIVISSSTYHAAYRDLLLVYVSSQISKALAPLDYVLKDWQQAGLPKPSFVRPKIAAIEPRLIVHQVGHLTVTDFGEVEHAVRLAMTLMKGSLLEVVTEVDFAKQPINVLQAVAEKSISELIRLANNHNQAVNLSKIQQMLNASNQ